MRLLFITSGIVSDILLLFFILFLSRNKSPLRISILKIFVTAFIAVSSNIIIAAAISETITNVAFTLYFSSLDFITYYMLMYAFTYTGKLQSLKEFVEFWRVAIIVDVLNLTASILSGHMYTIYPLTLSDGSIAYQTAPTSLYNVHLLLCYLPIIFTLVLLTISLSKSHSFYRAKYFPILVSLFVVIILNVAYMMFSLPFDWSVLFYPLTGFMLFFFSLYYIPRQLMNNTLSLAVDSMKEGLFLFDAEHNCIFVNKTAHDNFDITENDLSFDKYPLSLWLEDKDKDNLEDFRQIYPMNIKGKDLMIKVDYHICTDNKDDQLGAFFLIEDVTADQNMMKNLENARTEANQANAAKSIFLANMSHEIRTPMNSILGMNEMILRESTDEHILEYAGDIRKSGDTLISLINNILDFSKIESGNMEIRPTGYAVFQLLRECYHLVAHRAQEKDLPVEIKCAPDIPRELLGDMERIKQILINLLSNSIKYTREGKVTLSVRWTSFSDTEGIIEFVVSDTGQGISEEDITKLFKEFQRVDEEKNRTVEGTGLGLAICRELLKMMDGNITVSSTPGEGSVFTVNLPQKILNPIPSGEFVLVRETAPARSAYKESFHAPDARILVVDDIEMNLKLISALLKKTGMQISVANSGERAVEICKNEDFDLVLMDHMMPPPDGYETMKIIKEAGGHNAGIPFIVLTANAVEGAEVTYLSMGFDGYLSKPILSKELEEMLVRFLPKEKIHT
ncbi:MAG: response regulator [Lachnospiraceae bacterium]|nr:response regulator [Lachnospiraceae bacterium]